MTDMHPYDGIAAGGRAGCRRRRGPMAALVLALAALLAGGCASAGKAPKCPRGPYERVNTPDCYTVVEAGPADAPRRTSCPARAAANPAGAAGPIRGTGAAGTGRPPSAAEARP